MLTENYYFFKLLRYVKQQRLVKAWIVWAFEQNVLTESWFIEWIVFDGRWMRYTGKIAKLWIIFADCSDEISNGDWTGMRTDIVFDTLFRSVETKIGHGKSDTMDLWKRGFTNSEHLFTYNTMNTCVVPSRPTHECSVLLIEVYSEGHFYLFIMNTLHQLTTIMQRNHFKQI